MTIVNSAILEEYHDLAGFGVHWVSNIISSSTNWKGLCWHIHTQDHSQDDQCEKHFDNQWDDQCDKHFDDCDYQLNLAHI